MFPCCKVIQDHAMKLFKHLGQTICMFNQISLSVMYSPHVCGNPQPQTIISHGFPFVIKNINFCIYILYYERMLSCPVTMG